MRDACDTHTCCGVWIRERLTPLECADMSAVFEVVPQSRDRRSPNNSTRHSPDYGVIIVPSFSTSVALFLRSLITNVLFSPRVDHGPRGTSLKSTNFQSVTSVLCRPR